MEFKDWILLIVPILSNGVIIFSFQRIIEKRIMKLNKRQDIRDSVLFTFWEKLRDLNDLLIELNIQSRTDSSVAKNTILILGPKILEIVQYFDTNKYDLSHFENSINQFQNKWQDFNTQWNLCLNTTLTANMQLALGEKLQLVKEANQDLINEIRKKY